MFWSVFTELLFTTTYCHHTNSQIIAQEKHCDQKNRPFGLQRSFLKEDRLTVSIHANCPFKKYGTWSQRTINGNYSGNSFSRFYNRDYGINISYRFGSLKAQVKKTNTTIQNTDMVGGSSKSPTK